MMINSLAQLRKFKDYESLNKLIINLKTLSLAELEEAKNKPTDKKVEAEEQALLSINVFVKQAMENIDNNDPADQLIRSGSEDLLIKYEKHSVVKALSSGAEPFLLKILLQRLSHLHTKIGDTNSLTKAFIANQTILSTRGFINQSQGNDLKANLVDESLEFLISVYRHEKLPKLNSNLKNIKTYESSSIDNLSQILEFASKPIKRTFLESYREHLLAFIDNPDIKSDFKQDLIDKLVTHNIFTKEGQDSLNEAFDEAKNKELKALLSNQDLSETPITKKLLLDLLTTNSNGEFAKQVGEDAGKDFRLAKYNREEAKNILSKNISEFIEFYKKKKNYLLAKDANPNPSLKNLGSVLNDLNQAFTAVLSQVPLIIPRKNTLKNSLNRNKSLDDIDLLKSLETFANTENTQVLYPLMETKDEFLEKEFDKRIEKLISETNPEIDSEQNYVLSKLTETLLKANSKLGDNFSRFLQTLETLEQIYKRINFRNIKSNLGIKLIESESKNLKTLEEGEPRLDEFFNNVDDRQKKQVQKFYEEYKEYLLKIFQLVPGNISAKNELKNNYHDALVSSKLNTTLDKDLGIFEEAILDSFQVASGNPSSIKEDSVSNRIAIKELVAGDKEFAKIFIDRLLLQADNFDFKEEDGSKSKAFANKESLMSLLENLPELDSFDGKSFDKLTKLIQKYLKQNLYVTIRDSDALGKNFEVNEKLYKLSDEMKDPEFRKAIINNYIKLINLVPETDLTITNNIIAQVNDLIKEDNSFNQESVRKMLQPVLSKIRERILDKLSNENGVIKIEDSQYHRNIHKFQAFDVKSFMQYSFGYFSTQANIDFANSILENDANLGGFGTELAITQMKQLLTEEKTKQD